MEPKEFEEQLGDLETRVDRLRALYENWFRGYEKTEPAVARKDVERRVYQLRKELPRNTALRFRYHQLYQRYTTLGSYWSRTARQIEEGTYRLQLQRFRRKKGQQHEGEGDAGEAGDAREDKKERPQSYELDLNESLSVDDLLSEFEMDAVAKAVDRPAAFDSDPPTGTVRATFSKPKRKSSERPPAAVVPMMRESRGSTPPPAQSNKKRFADDEPDMPTGLHLSLEDEAPRAKPARPGAVRLSPLPDKPQAAPERHPLAPKGPATPGAAPGGPLGPTALGPTAPGQPRPSPLTAAQAPRAPGVPAPLGSAGVPRTSLAGAPPAPGAQPGVPRTSLAGGPPAVPPPPPRAAQATGAGAPPPAAPSGPGASAPRPAPGAPGVSGARPAPPPPPKPATPPARNTAPIQSGNTIVGHPPTRSPLAGAQPSAPSAPAADQRMRRIYNEYVEARRKNNEGDVKYESLVNSIERMMPDLQKKHAGKQIDFEVVVKDGRVGLKPKAT